jgi:TRAP-type mannitol/chloroaromatic compound transport system permease small subunit
MIFGKNYPGIIGNVVFILPISLLITYYGFDFAYLAFEIGEKSGDPGGLYYRFIIKSIIPLSFILVIISGNKYIGNE